MRCPECSKQLTEWIAQPDPETSVRLDFCENKHGVWFDRGELSSFIQRDLRDEKAFRDKIWILPNCRSCGAPNPENLGSCQYCGHSLHALCPRCDAGLFTAKFMGKQLALCSTCGGMWMQRDVVFAIQAFLQESRAGLYTCALCGKQGLSENDIVYYDNLTFCFHCDPNPVPEEKSDLKENFVKAAEWSFFGIAILGIYVVGQFIYDHLPDKWKSPPTPEWNSDWTEAQKDSDTKKTS